MIGNGLAYASAAVRDPQRVAGILERDFGLRRADCAVGGTGRTAPVLVVGETAVALFEIGDPFVGGAEKTGVHHLAVSTENLESAAREAQRLQVPSLPGRSEAGLAGARRILLDPDATGGIITWLSEPIDLPEPDRSLPRGAHAIPPKRRPSRPWRGETSPGICPRARSIRDWPCSPGPWPSPICATSWPAPPSDCWSARCGPRS